MTISIHNPVVQDLLVAIQDDEMSDITLVGQDGASVPATRFVLAARSKVLKRMLYGSFREATSRKIPFHEYDGVILEAIVEYCCRNEIPKFRLYIHRNAVSARRLVQLFKAADYLQLTGLARLVAQMAHNLMSRFPPLACAVYDEADLDTKVSNDALLMIQCRPYVTLPPDCETGGGIDGLSELKLASIYADNEVKAGELFLFEMLQKWLELSDYNPDDAEQVAHTCAEHLHLENIEPQDLLSLVMKSGIVAEKNITDAITQQALRASQNRVWSLSSRGRSMMERILVESAGSQNVNGIYYRIDGLANGELYSKREVACGQQYVYTLSIFVNKNEQVECRIFCSKLLTHRAIRDLARNRDRDSAFQPILQVIRTDEDYAEEEKGGSTTGSSKYTKLQLSDGEHFINARIRSSTRSKEIVQNTLIKVLDFDGYLVDGRVAVHLKKISIISQDPGHRFGNAAYYYDVFDEKDEDDGQLIISDGTPIENQICQELMHRQNAVLVTNSQTLVELYSCQYPLSEKPIDTKIPSTGWQIDSHGIGPGPRCRWIPAASSANQDDKKSKVSSHTCIAVTSISTPITSSRKQKAF